MPDLVQRKIEYTAVLIAPMRWRNPLTGAVNVTGFASISFSWAQVWVAAARSHRGGTLWPIARRATGFSVRAHFAGGASQGLVSHDWACRAQVLNGTNDHDAVYVVITCPEDSLSLNSTARGRSSPSLKAACYLSSPYRWVVISVQESERGGSVCETPRTGLFFSAHSRLPYGHSPQVYGLDPEFQRSFTLKVSTDIVEDVGWGALCAVLPPVGPKTLHMRRLCGVLPVCPKHLSRRQQVARRGCWRARRESSRDAGQPTWIFLSPGAHARFLRRPATEPRGREEIRKELHVPSR